MDVLAKAQALMARELAKAQAKEKQNKDEPSRDLVDNTVTKSKALTRAYYRFGLVEKRVMEAVVSKINPVSADKPQPIKLTAVEYAKAFNVDEKHAYEHLEKAGKAIMRRVIQVQESEKVLREMVLATEAVYNEGEGSVTIELYHKIVPHLVGLRNKLHTKYSLADGVDFSSSYTWRLYEILLSHQMPKKFTGGLIMGEWTYSVDELRKLLGVPKSYQWVHINDMLQKSVKEIKQGASINIEIERIKTSRKITHLKFQFAEEEQQKLKL